MGNTQSEIIPHISEEEVKQCKEQFANGGARALDEFLRNKAEQWQTVTLDIAIIGETGSGKSSFINAVRNLTADDEGSAAVDVVQGNIDPTPYPHPLNPLLNYWDLPGVGTPQYPTETYLERINFARYDFFLILSHKRFKSNEIWLANAITEKKKKFFFVRTHFHEDIENDKKSHPRTHKEGTVRAKILGELKLNLGNLYREDGVFLIDNYERRKYDFKLLEIRMIEDFPANKREAFILSCCILGERIIKQKAKWLRNNIWVGSLASGLEAVALIPGLSIVADIGIILTHRQVYLHQLGLDPRSLDHIATVMSCDVGVLNQIVSNSIGPLMTGEGLIAFIRTLPNVAAAMVTEEVVRIIPLVGSAIAAPISIGTTYYILYSMLDKMEETALLVMRTAVNNHAELI